MDESANGASHRANSPIADRLHAKVNAMALEAGEGEDDAGEAADTGAAEAEESTVTETPVAEVTTETAPAAEETPEQQDARLVREKRAALFDEKLKAAREKRQSQRLAEKARADRKAAEEERKAAASERAKYDGLKQGSFKETLEALGRDPRAAWEEMSKEAIEASTPEAQAKREREALKRELAEKLTPLEQELAELREERKQWAAAQAERRLVTGFQQAAADPAFKDLRIEYPDEALIDHAKHFDKNPDQLIAAAKEYGVRLTAPEKGFTMHELLSVLSAAQAAHNAGVQTRRAAMSPGEPQSPPPTVNGTAPRRNAGTAIGNDLAAQRASAKPEVSGLSAKEKVRLRADAEIRRSGGR